MPLGKVLVAAGLLLVAFGLYLILGGRTLPGHLPGDLRFEYKGIAIYIPLTTSVLISVLLSLFIWLFRK